MRHLNKVFLLAFISVNNVYGQSPCSHHSKLDSVAQSTNLETQYIPAPVSASNSFNDLSYLPPADTQEIPQANQQQPVYLAPPTAKLFIPQPLPQATYVKPVYQTLPSTVKPSPYPSVKPEIQPLPRTVQPKIVLPPLPKLQALPQKPLYQSPPQAFQPLRPLPPLPKASAPTPTFNKLPPLKPIVPQKPVPLAPKQIAPPKPSYQPKDNEVQATNTVGVKYDNQFFLKTLPIAPQPSNVQTKIIKPDLDTAAQTNNLRFASPQQGIKIHHYICDIGNADQKFLCDIYRLWDLHHPKDVNGNDLDNPGDNSNRYPSIAQLPSSPRPQPTYAPRPQPTYTPIPSTQRPLTFAPSSPKPAVITTTEAPTEAESDFENVPGDSQQNPNAIYLPPSSSYAPPTFTTVRPTQSTTVEIPKRVTPQPDNSLSVEDSEASIKYTSPPSTSYPITSSTSTTTTAAPVTGYEYPKPQPSGDSSDLVPSKEGYDYPKPSVPFPVPEKDGYDYPKPAISFSDSVAPAGRLENTISNSVVRAQAPDVSALSISVDEGKSSLNAFAQRLNQYPFGYSFASLSDGLIYQPPSNAPIVSTTLTPDIFLKSSGESIRYSYQPLQQSVTTLSPLDVSGGSYSIPAQPVTQSVSELSPLLLSKESLALSYSSTPPTSQTVTINPVEIKSNDISSESPFVTSTVAPLPQNFDSQLFGQFYSQNRPLNDPLNYNFDSAVPFNSNFSTFIYQPVSAGQSFSTASPITYSFQPLDQSFNSGQNSPVLGFSGQSQTQSQVPQQFISGQFSSFSNNQAEDQFRNSIQGQILSSKSGLSFGPNVQSVENLKDLQATAKDLNIDLRLGQKSRSQDEYSRNPSGSEEKEDISLGNIEILKVKRKTKSS